jgi:hypothetical protein
MIKCILPSGNIIKIPASDKRIKLSDNRIKVCENKIKVTPLLVLLDFDSLMLEEEVRPVHGQLDVSRHVADQLIDGEKEDEQQVLQAHPAQQLIRSGRPSLLQRQQAAVGHH